MNGSYNGEYSLGSQMRHDPWQAMVSRESINLLPACFVLKGLGPENEDLNVKLFVEGRKSPHTDKTEQLKTTPKVTESTPLSQRPAPSSTPLAPSRPAKTAPVQTTSSILQLDHVSTNESFDMILTTIDENNTITNEFINKYDSIYI